VSRLLSVTEPVTPATPPDSGDVVLIGDAVVGSGSEASGVFTILGRGSSDTDDGSWWPLQSIAAGDNCQMIWRMTTALTGSSVADFSGCGIQFRTALDDDKLIMNWWPNVGRMRWKYRDTDMGAVASGIFGDSGAALPHYGSIVYDNTYPRAQLWESTVGGTDPADWTLISSIDVDLSAGFDAGLYLVGEQSNAVTVTGVIDNVAITTQITIKEGTTVPVDPPDTPDPNIDTYFTGRNLTYNEAWRATSDIVLGYDWSMPADATPYAKGGVFHSGSSSPPTYWQGNLVKHLIVDWWQVEEVENTYTLDFITDGIASAVAGIYDGCILQFRGFVTDIIDAAGDPAKPEQVTAPTWMRTGYPTIQEGLHTSGVQITNLEISDSGVESRFLDLITAFGAEGITSNADLWASVLHGVSNSQGEEWGGTQAGSQAGITAMMGYIDAWAAVYGVDADKLAWMDERPEELHDRAVVTHGTGMRGGAIESWLMNKYTDHVGTVTSVESGQIYNHTTGHLSWEELCLPMSENRHWMDENEFETTYTTGPEPEFHYRAANLRMLQMRRNLAWIRTNFLLDPRMDNYLSLTLGKTATTSQDAWVWLCQHQAIIAGSHPEDINNFERWLIQNESDGVTTPSNRVMWLKDVTGDGRMISSNWYTDTCRKGSSIGITVDPTWLTGADSVAIKVTYFDIGTTSWTLEYDNGGGIGSGQGVTIMQNTGDKRTVTFFLTDFQANGGASKSFTLDDSTANIPFEFVRVIKV
jgi:hypothetical protein